MKKSLAVVLIALVAMSGTAFGQNVIATSSGNRWAGFYAGVNLGGVWNSTCNTWSASDSLLPPSAANVLSQRSCPNGSAFLGGLQLGYNFQFDQIVWGLGIDYEWVSSKSKTITRTVPAIPETNINGGTFTATGRSSGTGVLLYGPKVGYDFDGWLPYIRAGGVYQSGQPDITATYTDSVNGPFYFNGGKNAKNNGWQAGAGVAWMAADPVSVNLEYTYIDIGKSSSSTAYCSTNFAGGCKVFTNITVQNFHNSLTASMVRLEANYKFDF